MLSRLVITFLPRSKHLLISSLQSPSAVILEPKNIVIIYKLLRFIYLDGETVETVSAFILGGSKITADGDCSHEIKRPLFLGRKVMTNLDSLFKNRNITLPTKVCLVKDMVFPVVMYESWTVKKAEHQRIDALNCGVGEDS